MRPTRLCRVLSLVLAWAGSVPAIADDASSTKPHYLLGDWQGARTRLAGRGVTFQFGYTGEAAHNFRGGTRELTRYTDQWQLGTTLDLAELWGWHGATVQLTYTSRSGDNLGADAQIGNYQLIQEVYGRGQTVHLTDFWLEQKFLDGRLAWKLGWLTVGEDFASFGCDFQNLTFCGAQPGNLVGDYWLNWPTSVWATRLKLRTGPHSNVQLGAYQINPHYTDDRWARHNGWKLTNPGGTRGALLPLEFGWTPAWHGLPGSYRLGVWYATARGDDVILDENRQLQLLTGAAALQRPSRYGAYLVARQRLSGAPGGRGTTIFLNLTQADRRTAATDRQIALGLEYQGPFGRHRDVIGIAVGATHTNDRLARAARRANEITAGRAQPVRGNEYVGELFYGWAPLAGLVLRPNVQYVLHPGGNARNPDALVLGLKTVVTF